MTSAVSASLVFSALFAVPLMLSFMAEFTTAFSINELLNNFGTGFKNILYSAIRMLPEGTYTSFFAMAGIDSAVEFTDLLYARMAFTFPATVCLSLMLMASCAHWVFKQFCLKADLPQMRDSYYFMGKFCFVRISMTASMIYMLCSLLTFLTLENEDAMFFSNLSTIFSYVFAYGGIALVDYFLYRRIKAHPTVRVITGLFLAGLCILPMGISYIVSFVGLADSCWNLRRFITAKEGTVL